MIPSLVNRDKDVRAG